MSTGMEDKIRRRMMAYIGVDDTSYLWCLLTRMLDLSPHVCLGWPRTNVPGTRVYDPSAFCERDVWQVISPRHEISPVFLALTAFFAPLQVGWAADVVMSTRVLGCAQLRHVRPQQAGSSCTRKHVVAYLCASSYASALCRPFSSGRRFIQRPVYDFLFYAL